MGPAVEAVLAKLRASGGRITATRRATVEILFANRHRHVSAEEIVGEVRARHPDVAESTVYRTLTALEELGVVNHVHLDHGPATFHLSEDDHRHLVCQTCHHIIEIPAEFFTSLSEQLESRYGFALSGEHFAVSGQCRVCRERTKSDGAR